MNNVLIIAANDKYIQHAKSLFANAMNEGKWKGDYCLITDDIYNPEIEKIKEKGITIKEVKSEDHSFYLKFNIFDVFFKQWKKILYLDCDVMIYKPLELITSLPDILYGDPEEWTVKQYFTSWSDEGYHENGYSGIDKNLVLELEKEFSSINNMGYNCGTLFFHSDLIQNNTLELLNFYRNKYEKINKHTGNKFGSDMPIINLLFLNKWTKIPDNMISYWQRQDQRTVFSHFCHWHAPWLFNMLSPLGKTYVEVYRKNLEFFEKKFNL